MPAMPTIEDVDGAAAMGRDAPMGRIWIVAVAALGLVWLGGRANEAVAAPQGAAPQRAAQARPPVSDLSSQRRVRRSAVRITVHPRLIGPRTRSFDVYPRAYPYDWPGPLAKRDCVAWLAAEARPSGTFIVPRQRCWWYFPG